MTLKKGLKELDGRIKLGAAGGSCFIFFGTVKELRKELKYLDGIYEQAEDYIPLEKREIVEIYDSSVDDSKIVLIDGKECGAKWWETDSAGSHRVSRNGGRKKVSRPELYKVIGERIRVTRRENVLTQKDLMAKTGISRTKMSTIETGRAAPTVEELCDLADALGVTTDYMLGRE